MNRGGDIITSIILIEMKSYRRIEIYNKPSNTLTRKIVNVNSVLAKQKNQQWKLSDEWLDKKEKKETFCYYCSLSLVFIHLFSRFGCNDCANNDIVPNTMLMQTNFNVYSIQVTTVFMTSSRCISIISSVNKLTGHIFCYT